MSLRQRVPAGLRIQLREGLPANRVLVGDCLEELARLPSGSVDLVFADPPYNLQLEQELLRPNNTVVDGVDDAWDKFSSFADYDRFSRAWLAECRRVLKPDGAMWVIGSYHNIFRLGVALQDLGFWIQNDIVWRKTNPMPNFRGKRFTNAHETLIWAGRDAKSRVTFNYEAMKALNDDIQMRSDWLFPICSGPERLKERRGPQGASDAETRGAAQPHPAGQHESGRSRARSLLRHRHHRRGRQAARPALARHRARCGLRQGGARSASPRCDRCRPRRWRRRSPSAPSRACPSAPSSSCGILEPGKTLTDERGRLRAEVKADGTLAFAGRQGSIHRLGAEVQGKAACNGWTFWHYEAEGGGSRSTSCARRRAGSSAWRPCPRAGDRHARPIQGRAWRMAGLAAVNVQTAAGSR